MRLMFQPCSCHESKFQGGLQLQFIKARAYACESDRCPSRATVAQSQQIEEPGTWGDTERKSLDRNTMLGTNMLADSERLETP
jgi:hypothetical protein